MTEIGLDTIKFAAWAIGALITTLATIVAVYIRLSIANAVQSATVAIRDILEKRYVTHREMDTRMNDYDRRIKQLEG